MHAERDKSTKERKNVVHAVPFPSQFLQVEVENISDPIGKGVLAKKIIYVEEKQTISRVYLYSTCEYMYKLIYRYRYIYIMIS